MKPLKLNNYGMRGVQRREWGLVVIVGGYWRGRWGEYDDDDENGNAIVILHGMDMEDPRAGNSVTVKVGSLRRPFGDWNAI